ncbi:unnamed protein product [Phytophthora lilii]|uniref:Unnamed protein product n=1 Tax=Phytophthora lilii TaxID=2077276 RepID=A0A9W7D826_9STRA|nr:unnamed protein product [Phytophthora lilii]
MAWQVKSTPGRAPNGCLGYGASGGSEPMGLAWLSSETFTAMPVVGKDTCRVAGLNRGGAGMQDTSRAGHSTEEALRLHERCAGGAHQGGVASERLCTLETEKGSGGLLVIRASVRRYSNPFRVLINSGASKSFARRQTVARNGDMFADTLPAEVSEEIVEDASCVDNIVPRMVEMTEESEVVIDTSSVANTAPHDASEARNAPLREASHLENMGPRDAIEECYHIYDGETGRRIKAGAVHLAALPEVSELLNLEEMSMVDFLAELQAGEIALLRPELSPEKINSSSVIDEAVLEELKKRREARLGSEVIKNPKDPVYPLLTEFADVVSKDPPLQLPPDRGVRQEIDLVPGTNTVSPGSGFCLASNARSLMPSSPQKRRQAWCGSRNPRTRRQPSAFGSRKVAHAYNKLNRATVPAQTPIPRKDVLLNNMDGYTLFSALDLVDGYYQILMRESDTDRTPRNDSLSFDMAR